MLVAAALLLSSASDVAATRAEWALRHAEASRFQLAVTLCDDAGRRADYQRLHAAQERLERQFHRMFGRFAINEIVMDDRGDCENPRGFRRYVSAYGNALADAQDALGTE